MIKVHILKVKVDDKDKAGNLLISKKYGKPFYKVGIQTQEFGNDWLNGLMNFPPNNWEGTEQEIEQYDEDYQGKTYKKFKIVSKAVQTAADVFVMSKEIHTKLDQIIELLKK